LRSATKTACRSSNPNPGYTKFCTPSIASAKEKPTYNDPDPELFRQVGSVSEKSDSQHCFGAITSHVKVSIKFSVIDYP
ncbi:hypothetical protein, partial [Pseudomonas aeruginosa]